MNVDTNNREISIPPKHSSEQPPSISLTTISLEGKNSLIDSMANISAHSSDHSMETKNTNLGNENLNGTATAEASFGNYTLNGNTELYK